MEEERKEVEIWKDREMGLSLKSLSNKYNTRIGNISFIINRQTWKYV